MQPPQGQMAQRRLRHTAFAAHGMSFCLPFSLFELTDACFVLLARSDRFSSSLCRSHGARSAHCFVLSASMAPSLAPAQFHRVYCHKDFLSGQNVHEQYVSAFADAFRFQACFSGCTSCRATELRVKCSACVGSMTLPQIRSARFGSTRLRMSC